MKHLYFQSIYFYYSCSSLFKVKFSQHFFIFSYPLTDDCFSLEIQIDTDDSEDCCKSFISVFCSRATYRFFCYCIVLVVFIFRLKRLYFRLFDSEYDFFSFSGVFILNLSECWLFLILSWEWTCLAQCYEGFWLVFVLTFQCFWVFSWDFWIFCHRWQEFTVLELFMLYLVVFWQIFWFWFGFWSDFLKLLQWYFVGEAVIDNKFNFRINLMIIKIQWCQYPD